MTAPQILGSSDVRWYLKNKIGLQEIFGFVIIFLLSLFVANYAGLISSDSEEYRSIYESLIGEFFSPYDFNRKEYIFYYWNNFFAGIGFSFEQFLFVSTFIFLGIKVAALNILSGHQGILRIIFLYVLILFLLHDSIQIKISWALSLAIWSCVYISRQRFVIAAVLGLLSAGFQFTVILLPLVYLISAEFKVVSKKFYYFFILLMLISIYWAQHIIEFFLGLFAYLDQRYLEYISSERVESQNSSGMFYYYFVYYLLVILFISYVLRRSQNRVIKTQLIVLQLSLCTLWIFKDFVALASRLSDVLIILLVPVLGFILDKKIKCPSVCVFFVWLWCFGLFLARAYVNWGLFGFL